MENIEEKEKAAEESTANEQKNDDDKYFNWGDAWDCGKVWR